MYGTIPAATVILMMAAPALGVVWPENLTSRANVVTGKCNVKQLADVGVKVAPAFSAKVTDAPAILELAWPSPVKFDMLVCRWRKPPADYTVSIASDGTWQDVIKVADNRIELDKIHLRILDSQTVDRLRVTIAKPVAKDGTCALDSLEIYRRAELPKPIADFVNRPTPRLLDSSATAKKLRAQHRNDKHDRQILDAEIPTWEPITLQQYSGKPEGRRINQLSGKKMALQADAAEKYFTTGQREYAQKAWAVFSSFIDHYDRHQSFRFRGRQWQAVTYQDPGYHIEADTRGYDRIADALTIEQRLRTLYYFLDLGDYQYDVLRSIPSRANWVPNSIGALTLLAWYLADFPESPHWIRRCDEKMRGFFQVGPNFFLEDGSWWECSPAHHYYVLKGFHKYALAKHLLGDPIWTRPQGRLTLADTIEVFARMANPLGEYPSINDSYGHVEPLRTMRPLLEMATLMQRGDLLRAWQAKPVWPDSPALCPKPIALREPDYPSVLLPATGLAILRDGWNPNDSFLLLDYGPHGGGHGHPDKLNVILVADGRYWLPDAACAPHYSVFPEQRQWHKQTVAHNTVLVDGKSQKPCTGSLVRWHSEAGLDVVTAECRNAYVATRKENGKAKTIPAIRHRRTVLHPRREYFLIHDTIEALDGQPHTAEALFHVYGQPAGQQPCRLRFKADGKTFDILSPAISDEAIAMEKGLCGGLELEKHKGDGYPAKGQPGWIYIPFFRLKKTVSAQKPEAHFWTVAVPESATWKPQKIEPLAVDGADVGVRITGPDGADVIAEPGLDRPFAYRMASLASDAPLVYVRVHNDKVACSRRFGGSTATWAATPLTDAASVSAERKP